MNTPTPRTDAHQQREHMAHDHLWSDFARSLERECNMLRAAFGIEPDEKIPEQEHKYGSILIDRGGSRLRISPVTDEMVSLERELNEAKQIMDSQAAELKLTDRPIHDALRAQLAAVTKERDEWSVQGTTPHGLAMQLTTITAERDATNKLLADTANELIRAHAEIRGLKTLISKSSLIEVDASISTSDACGKPVFVNDGKMLVHKDNLARQQEKTRLLQKMAGMARKIAMLESELSNSTGK